MPGKLGNLTIDIAADVAHLRRDMGSAEKTIKTSTDKIAASAKRAGRALATIGGAVVFGVLTRKVIQATAEQEAAIKQLEQGLASTGGIVGQSLDELTKKAAELQKASTFGDEEIIRAQSQLVTFTNIVGEQFDKTIVAAADLSTRMGTDLKSSVLQLGKALNDPVKNLSALSRSGIQFSKEQQALIKSLAETGRIAEAQTIILGELETQFGGSAKAARDTFGGAIDSLKNAFVDLLEADSLPGVTAEINELTDLLQDESTIAAAQTLANAIIKSFAAATKAIVGTINVVDFLAESFASAVNGPAVGDQRMLDQLAEYKVELEDLQTRFKNGSLGFFEVVGAEDRIKFLDDEVARMQVLVDLNEEVGKSKSVSATPVAASSAGVGGIHVIDQKALEDELKELDKVLKDRNEAIEKYNKEISAQGISITESVFTSQEEYSSNVAGLQNLLNENAISQDTYNRKLAEYDEILAKATPGIQSFAELQTALTDTLSPQEAALSRVRDQMIDLDAAMSDFPEKADEIALAMARLKQEEQEIIAKTDEVDKELSEFGKEASRNIQNSIVDTLKNGFDDGFDGILNSFGDMLLEMALQATAADIAGAIFDDSTSNSADLVSGVGNLFSGIGNLFGFSFDGGGYTGSGPRTGGIDGKGGFPAILHSNETVVDHTKGQGLGGLNIGNITFPGVRDERSARKAAGQFARELNGLVSSGRKYS